MQKRILVVEDDPMQRHLMSLFLGWHDYDVHTAEDGAEAVRKCIKGDFKLVLMDYKLPVVDGHSAAKIISSFSRGRTSPIIVGLTSSLDRLWDKDNREPSGFAAIEGKPWDPRSLIEMLDGYREEQWIEAEEPEPMLVASAGGLAVEDARAVEVKRKLTGFDGLRPSGPPRILIAEDDELLRSLLASALGQRNYEVGVASDGLEAVLMLSRRQYDVVVMDYYLPKIDGLTAAQLARDLLPSQCKPSMIALTSSPTLVRNAEEGPPFTFDAVIPKTKDLRFIMAAIDRNLGA